MPKRHDRSPAAAERRKATIKRLENQLLTGFKTVTNAETGEVGTEKLTDDDRQRINKEIETLKTRV
jgi:hypothetical protein